MLVKSGQAASPRPPPSSPRGLRARLYGSAGGGTTQPRASCFLGGRGKASPQRGARGKGRRGSSGLTAISRSPGECKQRHTLEEEPRPRLPGEGLHRHISRVCSIGWCWSSAPHVFSLLSVMGKRGEGGFLLPAWLSGMAEPRCPTGCHQVSPQWLPRGAAGTQWQPRGGTRRGWVTPPGCGEALGSPDNQLRPLWLFGARLDLASLSRGVEARAGAVKVFHRNVGLPAGVRVGKSPF